MTHTYRILLAFSLFAAPFSVVQAQSDTTEYLFKKARFSYVQYHVGYQPMFFANGQTAHGFSIQMLGVVFNDKIALGLDFDGFTKQQPYAIQSYPFHTMFMGMSLSIEPLIRPKKVLNFSFPVKLGYGGAQTYAISTPNFFTVKNPQFFVVAPSAIVWVNLFKPLSLGVGASYRMCFNKDAETFADYSGLSVNATLRLKWYTKEWQEKMMKRQAEYMRMQPKPAN
jgi:hypothetical protein